MRSFELKNNGSVICQNCGIYLKHEFTEIFIYLNMLIRMWKNNQLIKLEKISKSEKNK